MTKVSSTIKIPSPIQEIYFDWAKEKNLQFFVKRDDLIHAEISGNKWRKLKYNILQANHLKKKGIITFGGAFSNHVLATAYACRLFDLKSLAIIRGDELTTQSNFILKKCSEQGMNFEFISRSEYRLRDDWDYLNELKSKYPDYYLVPEGGKNYFGVIGCQEIIEEIKIPFDDIWTAQGTCTTSVGLSLAISPSQMVHGVPVLSGFDAKKEMESLFNSIGISSELVTECMSNMKFHENYSFGGYGKTTAELLNFIASVKENHGLDLDPVYTGKAFYAMLDYYQKNSIENKTIVFLHTGGLIAGEGIYQK